MGWPAVLKETLNPRRQHLPPYTHNRAQPISPGSWLAPAGPRIPDLRIGRDVIREHVAVQHLQKDLCLGACGVDIRRSPFNVKEAWRKQSPES